MKLQSFSNFALNNQELEATKGGKRTAARTTPAMAALLNTGTNTAKTASGTTTTNIVCCPVTKTTMLSSGTHNICIEWKNGMATPSSI